MPDQRAVLERIFGAQLARHYLHHGPVDVYVAGGAADAAAVGGANTAGEILGVAVWDRPDAPSGPLVQLKMALIYARYLGRQAIPALRYDRRCAALYPRFPHWHLHLLAIKPGHQGEGIGSALLGHPLNVLPWLAQDLASRGQRLRAGDLVSLGGFSPALPVEAGRTYVVRYEGLVPGQSVAVSVRAR